MLMLIAETITGQMHYMKQSKIIIPILFAC